MKGLISELSRFSGKRYGVLVHGNRLIEALIFKLVGGAALEGEKFDVAALDLEAKTNGVVDKMVKIIEEHYADNFMATLFKNTDKCSDIFSKAS
ncbi:hypothetical protein [Rudaea sp.]|uniref:hypothetical protein n=1 Tax=Rudaea sp. TaxID=2136325 RepID=UPI00321F714E